MSIVVQQARIPLVPDNTRRMTHRTESDARIDDAQGRNALAKSCAATNDAIDLTLPDDRRCQVGFCRTAEYDVVVALYDVRRRERIRVIDETSLHGVVTRGTKHNGPRQRQGVVAELAAAEAAAIHHDLDLVEQCRGILDATWHESPA